MTAEEAETLHELRETCEDHLNTLARVVESGGVHDDALLQRAIEVAESLVAAIGDDETVAAAAAAETESRGHALPAADPAVGISSGAADDSGTEGGQRGRRDLADLLGGLDVDPGGARNRRRGPRRAAEHRGGRGGDGCRGDRREPGRGGAAAGGSGAAAGAGGAADATATRQPD